MRLSLHEYFPYGEEATTSTGTFPLRFTGHERDFFATGGATPNQDDLDCLRARVRGPVTARFPSFGPATPLELTMPKPQAWNRHTYASGSSTIPQRIEPTPELPRQVDRGHGPRCIHVDTGKSTRRLERTAGLIAS